MEQQQQLRSQEKVHAVREQQQDLILQQIYEQKKEQILSRPTSHTTTHPFRKPLHPASASRGPPSW